MHDNSQLTDEELATIRAQRKADGKSVSEIDREQNSRKSTERLEAEIASRQKVKKPTRLLEEELNSRG